MASGWYTCARFEAMTAPRSKATVTSTPAEYRRPYERRVGGLGVGKPASTSGQNQMIRSTANRSASQRTLLTCARSGRPWCRQIEPDRHREARIDRTNSIIPREAGTCRGPSVSDERT